MTNTLNRVRAYLLAFFTPTTGKIVASILKLETTLERAISLDTVKLAGLAAAKAAITNQLSATNRDVDAAYKLLHKVTEVTR